MLKSGTKPPIGVKLSCIVFTAPQLASVVTVVKSAEAAMPKRVSFPSQLPLWPATPKRARVGFPFCSAPVADERAHQEHNRAGGEHGPALSPVANHHAKRVSQPRWNNKDENKLNQIG